MDKVSIKVKHNVEDEIIRLCRADGPVTIADMMYSVYDQVSGPWDATKDVKLIKNTVVEAVQSLSTTKTIVPYDEHAWW